MTAPRRAAAVMGVGVLGVLGAACSVTGIASPPPARPGGRPVTFVAIGGSDTFEQGRGDAGRDGWADLVYRSDFGEAATFYELSGPDETVSSALAGLVPEAVSLHPAVTAVWLGSLDALGATPVADYAVRLAALVRELQQGGTRVLLGDLPPLQLYPAYAACQAAPRRCGVDLATLPAPSVTAATISAYNTATAAVAAAQHVQLVELNRTLTTALLGTAADTGPTEPPGQTVAESGGLGLTDAGNALVARAFGSVIGRRELQSPKGRSPVRS